MQSPPSAMDADRAQAAAQAGVLIGRDDQLFLIGGNHAVLEFLTGERRPSAASVQTFHANISARKAACAEAGIAYTHVVFPDPLVTLEDWHDHDVQSLYQRDYASQADPQLARAICYPLEVLRGRKDCQLTYDSHYSALGNLAVARQVLMQFPGALPKLPDIETWDTVVTHNDLLRRIDPTATAQQKQKAPPAAGATRVNNGLQNRQNGIMDIVTSPNAITDKTLLIFGDSFLRQLINAFSYMFAKVVFCRTPYFHSEMVPAVAPDVIVTGNAERYLSNCKSDAERSHFLSIGLEAGAAQTPSDGFKQVWAEVIDRKGLLRG